ncbi:MAG: tryptophan--tRNA ligase [Candidatus Wildermuthbacteria bacterium]|nr:tryptophan--tRNA ligase [Candidatus Wildermuthbacteria bacterium]
MAKVVLSGIRATGGLHFGNLLGAVQHFVRFQNQPDTVCLFFVADQHTLTTLKDHKGLQHNLVEIVKDYLAAGLDPERSILYAQSSVPEITELTLYLGMYQPLGELENIPTFKELVRKNPDMVSHGLLTYPVLMAADILGPRATLVPVGEDQVPNVELARSLARRFNRRFGETFPVPEMMDEMIRVPGLDGEKMGKSEADNAIDIHASADKILERYRTKGITDPARMRLEDPGNPENCKSVFPIHRIIADGPKLGQIYEGCMKATMGCAECKEHLVDGIWQILAPFQERREKLAEQDDYVYEVLHEGAKKARARVAQTIAEVREKIGIRIF